MHSGAVCSPDCFTEMYLSQAALAWLYLWSFLTGVFLGGVYDCLRLSRLLPGGVPPTRLRARRLPLLGGLPQVRRRKAAAVLIFFEDLFFGIVAGIAVVLLFYEAFDGNIRIPALLLVAAGFGVFHVSFGRLAMRAAALISFALEVAVRYVCYVGAMPARALAGWLGRLRRAAEKRARARYTEEKFKDLQRKEAWEHDGENKKKAVQSEPDGADLSCGARGRVDRGVHQQRHAV